MKYSKNAKAKEIMGLRPTDCVAINQPCELGYHCPVCEYPYTIDGNFDERLEWSEYNGFIWCRVCNKDYPSCFCHPNMDAKIDIFLEIVKDLKGGKDERNKV